MKKTCVTVSVIIAARDAELFIFDALKSALGQSLTDIEVIVVDDGSRDRTAEIVRGYQVADSRVVLLRHEISLGVSAARNTALTAASGRWIAILDADDELLADRLQWMVDEAESLGADLLGDNLLVRDFHTKEPLGLAFPSAWMTISQPLTILNLLERDNPDVEGNMIGIIKPIMRRSFLQMENINYHASVSVAEDFLLYAQCIMRGANFCVIDRASYVYYIRRNSTSRGPNAASQVARVNSILLKDARRYSPSLVAMIKKRQAALDFESVRQAARRRDGVRMATAILRVPPLFLMRQLFEIGRRRLMLIAGPN